jgi:hypothetical protein
MELHRLRKIDQKAIEDICEKYQVQHVHSGFVSNYLWQDVFGHQIFIEEDLLLAKVTMLGENCWHFPIGATEKKLSFIKEHLYEADFTLDYLSLEDAQFLATHFPFLFRFERTPDNYEYLYKVEDLISLSGKSARHQRQNASYFEKAYEIEIQEVTQKNLPDAQKILECWQERHQHIEDSDYEIVKRALAEVGGLLTGLLLYRDGEPSSFTLGAPYAKGKYDYVVAKFVESIRGEDNYLARALCQKLQGEYEYINYEEDLGVMGLRAHKLRLHPAVLTKTYKASRELHGYELFFQKS